MLYLAEASRQEGLSEEEAAYITAHLLWHHQTLENLLLVSWHAARNMFLPVCTNWPRPTWRPMPAYRAWPP